MVDAPRSRRPRARPLAQRRRPLPATASARNSHLLPLSLSTHLASAIDVAWGLPSPGKAAWEPVSAAVGDKIKFKWAGGMAMGLAQVSSGTCLANEDVYHKTPGAIVKEVNFGGRTTEWGEVQTSSFSRRPPLTPHRSPHFSHKATHATPAFEYTFTAAKKGKYYFVDPDACAKGAKLEVVVA